MTKAELLDFYNHRDCDDWLTYYRYLTDEDKKVLEEIDAEETVKKWRKNGILINWINWFSEEYKKRYEPYIELQEFEEANLYLWLAINVCGLHSGTRNEEDVKKDISKIWQEQKMLAVDLLKKTKDKPENKDFLKEINFVLDCLEESHE